MYIERCHTTKKPDKIGWSRSVVFKNLNLFDERGKQRTGITLAMIGHGQWHLAAKRAPILPNFSIYYRPQLLNIGSDNVFLQ